MTFEATLLLLKKQYLDVFPLQQMTVRQLWQQLTEDWQQVTLDTLHRTVHSLKGSGGTFGFVEISQHAGAIEKALKPFMSGEQQPNPAQLSALNELVQLLLNISTKDMLPENASPAPKANKPTLDPRSITPESVHIAVVEPDPALGQLLSSQLTEFYFTVRTFQSFAEFKDSDSKQQHQVVLMDLTITDIDQQEIFKQAKLLEAAGQRVFIQSDISNFALRLAATRANVTEFLLKPANISDLVHKIRTAVRMDELRPFKILMVDDQSAMTHYFSELLQEHEMQVTTLNKPEEILQALETCDPDLFMFDMYMPEVTGLELAKVIRQFEKWQTTPIIFLSADDNEHTKAKIIQTGSDDLLSKQTPPHLLISQIRARAARGQKQRQRVSKDSLTGLLNHAQILNSAEHCYKMTQRQKGSMCLAMLDLDFFKKVNDQYGHAAGDKVLLTFSHFLQQSLRQTDYIGRYGGEEFMAVFPDTSMEQITEKLNTLRVNFSRVQFNEQGSSFHVTFSGGLVSNHQGKSIEALLAKVDKLLYKAKAAGRNQIAVLEPENK